MLNPNVIHAFTHHYQSHWRSQIVLKHFALFLEFTLPIIVHTVENLIQTELHQCTNVQSFDVLFLWIVNSKQVNEVFVFCLLNGCENVLIESKHLFSLSLEFMANGMQIVK